MLLVVDVTKRLFDFVAGLAIAFFGLYVYDRWEDEIDKHIKDAYSHVRKLTSKVPRGP